MRSLSRQLRRAARRCSYIGRTIILSQTTQATRRSLAAAAAASSEQKRGPGWGWEAGVLTAIVTVGAIAMYMTDDRHQRRIPASIREPIKQAMALEKQVLLHFLSLLFVIVFVVLFCIYRRIRLLTETGGISSPIRPRFSTGKTMLTPSISLIIVVSTQASADNRGRASEERELSAG